jgi:hypothetical protein
MTRSGVQDSKALRGEVKTESRVDWREVWNNRLLWQTVFFWTEFTVYLSRLPLRLVVFWQYAGKGTRHGIAG